MLTKKKDKPSPTIKVKPMSKDRIKELLLDYYSPTDYQHYISKEKDYQ